MQNNQNCFEFPQELCIKPLVVIGFSGLDVVNNAGHKAIWEAFSSNRRTERAPILFKVIENHHEFPVIKPKRNSYDWYIPKGILKRNWINKHLYEIPAVMVIFYDLDWSDIQWREKVIECASRVRSMRAALEGRNTRIIVVLVQNTPPHPASEDVLASEGAISLCTSCEISAQSLFVLPHGEHLHGYTMRLEDAFFELAQGYYHNEAKIIKGHKDQLNKNIHQYLFIRHQFKIGFFYELKQDIQTALKHYTHSYNNLLEVRIVDTNALEIRTVAGFINYKLCRLLFAINLPRDAINQFKAHIDRFKTRFGFQELSFEHYAWLSKQFSIFGDVFDEAVKLGTLAVQTQHPGLYYQQAAQYAILRKKTCQELCTKVIAYPFPDPLENAGHMEFYGQRPWRPGKLSAEPPDPHLEQSGIEALQYLEKQVNHSSLIITLFGLAISQFKTYRCPRTRRYLVLQMADEYYESKDYGKALTLNTHMLWDFRAEKWWLILSKILEKGLICAFLTATIQDYISLAIELLGPYTEVSLDNKRRVYENLIRILKKQIPFGDPSLPQDMMQNAILIWQPVVSGDPVNLSLDMTNINCCVSTKARFTKTHYEIDQKVTVEVFVRCNCPFPLSFSKVSATINTASYSSEFAVSSLHNVTLGFHKDEVKKFLIEFMVDPSDINKEINIGSINLLLGDPSECSIDLKFCPSNNTSLDNHPELTHFKFKPTDKLDFDNIQPLSTAGIVPRESKLNVVFDHHQPALVGEWYEIKVKVTNEEAYPISDIQMKVNVIDGEEPVTVHLTNDLRSPQTHTTTLPVELDDSTCLDVRTTSATAFFIKSHKPCQISLQVQITYTLKSLKPVFSIKCETVVLPVVQPFKLTTKFMSMLMEDLDRFYVKEEFSILNQIEFSSPWPVVIEDTSFNLLNPVSSAEETHASVLNGKIFADGEAGTELFVVVCDKTSQQNTNLGQYQIKWKRENGVSTTTSFPIQGLLCEYIPLGLKMVSPPHGFVRTPMVLSYHLINHSAEFISLEVAMEGSEAFMFSGYKQFQVSILPYSTKTLEYIMYPLLAGSVVLPRLVLSDSGGNNSEEKVFIVDQLQLNSLTKRALPSHIYVMPQMKGNVKLSEIVLPRKATKAY